MKKKLFSYLTLAFAIMSIGLIGSCRDYDEDVFRVKQELKDKDSDLYDTIINRYNRAIDSVKALRTAVNNKFNQVDNKMNQIESTMKTNDSILAKRDSVISDSLKKLYDDTKAADQALKNRIDSIAGVLAAMNTKLDSLAALNHDPYNDSVVKARIDSLAALPHGTSYNDSVLKARIDSLAALPHGTTYNDSVIKAKIDSLSALSHDTCSCTPYNDSLLLKHDSILFDSVYSYYRHFQVIDSTLNAVQDTLDSLKVRVDTLTARVNRLEEKVEKLWDAEQKRITSLYVQGALNPAFGYFALPGGIKSNILMGYYGEASYNVTFPAIMGSSPTAALIYDDPNPKMLQASEISKIGGFGSIPSLTFNQNDVIPGDTAKLGKIYLTINPNEVELDSTYTFKFVNSLGQESKAIIDSLKPCTDKLQFGYTTRAAASSNGFYEANVSVLANDADSIKPEIALDKEQLKSIVNKLRNRQLDLSGIAGAAYDLLQTKLDAYAVKTSWSDSLGDHNITSYYDVAVTAVKPLSFAAMQGMGAGHSLPTISPIGDLLSLLDTTSITISSFDPVDFSGVIVNINTVTLSIPNTAEVTYTMGSGAPATVDLTLLKSKLQTDMNNYSDSIEAMATSLIAQIQDKINDMLTDVKAELQSSVRSMVADMNSDINGAFSSYISKMNAAINKINALTSRINRVISLGAGAFLQPVLVYEGVDGAMHPVSNDPAYPSVANGVIGKEIILYPTSYSGELLAPAYKKYVAIVDVIGGTMNATTNSGSGSFFNQIIDGGRYGIDFTPTQAGTYVIYYSAIDYSGRIAANRFYIKVQ